MRAQTNIEILLVVAIAIIFSFFVLGKYLSVHETIFKDAAVRSQVIYSISQSGTKYVYSDSNFADCPDELKYNIIIEPAPLGAEEAQMTARIKAAIREYGSDPTKNITIFYNSVDPLTGMETDTTC